MVCIWEEANAGRFFPIFILGGEQYLTIFQICRYSQNRFLLKQCSVLSPEKDQNEKNASDPGDKIIPIPVIIVITPVFTIFISL